MHIICDETRYIDIDPEDIIYQDEFALCIPMPELTGDDLSRVKDQTIRFDLRKEIPEYREILDINFDYVNEEIYFYLLKKNGKDTMEDSNDDHGS